MANIIGIVTINQNKFVELDDNPLLAPTSGLNVGDFCVVDGQKGVWQKTGPGSSEFVRIDLWTTFSNQATATGTLTLNAASNAVLVFTGTAIGQIVKLPNATTLVNGFPYYIFNDSTQTIQIQDSAGGSVYSLAAQSRAYVMLADNSTVAGSWAVDITLPLGAPVPHASTHRPATGSDPLATAAPTTTLSPVITNTAGTGDSFSRNDHTHAIATGTPSTIGTANAEGTGTAFARNDHIHNHGSQTTPTHHAVATPSANGFMSSTDKAKLDLLITKSGRVGAASFTGSPRKATVTFAAPFASTNYSLVITGVDARIWSYESKSASSFVISANANTALTGEVSWQAQFDGEVG